MKQKDFFNKIANTWDTMVIHDMEKVEHILDLIQIQAGSYVLDVGTGTGVLIPSLSQRVTQQGIIKAVDVAERMIEIAKKKHSFDNVVFECGDVLKSNKDESMYDHVICYSMFPHFQNKEEAIQKLSEKLKIGGKLTICHSQSREEINHLHKEINDVVNNDCLPTISTLKEYFIMANFNEIMEVDNEEMFIISGCKYKGSCMVT